MARDLINRYVWLVDTLRRYGRLTREQIDNLWQQSPISNGEPLPRRTFFHYRRAIEENFNINVACDGFGRYYIDHDDNASQKAYTNWMLDSFAINNALRDAGDAQERVDIEDVPSARSFMPQTLDAIRLHQKILFSYAGFNRSRIDRDILFHPYFLKRYKQRWYMVGLREKTNDIRTYALDRVTQMAFAGDSFNMPETPTLDDLFGHIVGVSSNHGEVKNVRLQTSASQAKYLRALPLHDSQQEEIHENYSIFSYSLKLNWELVHEILGMGSEVKVLAPPELVLMVKNDLQKTLALYSPDSKV